MPAKIDQDLDEILDEAEIVTLNVGKVKVIIANITGIVKQGNEYALKVRDTHNPNMTTSYTINGEAARYLSLMGGLKIQGEEHGKS